MIVNRDWTNLSETQTILTIPLNVRKSYWTITEKKIPENLGRDGRRSVRCKHWRQLIARYSDVERKERKRNQERWIPDAIRPEPILPSTNWRRVAGKWKSPHRSLVKPTESRCCRTVYRWDRCPYPAVGEYWCRNGRTPLLVYSFHFHPQIQTNRNLVDVMKLRLLKIHQITIINIYQIRKIENYSSKNFSN